MGNGKVYQVTTAVASGMGSLLLGLLYVWPSYTLPMLAESNCTILSTQLTHTEEAMLGSLPCLGAVFGSLIVGFMIETFGRKGATMIVSLEFIISWVMVGYTRSVTVVLVARFIGGLAAGTTSVITPIYISEVCEDRIRGLLASVTIVFYSVGLIVSYFIGWYCSYLTVVWINIAITAVRLSLIFFIPESPVYLMKKNKVEEARKAMAVYRGAHPSSTIVHDELSRIKQEISSPVCLDTMNEKGEEVEKKKLTSEEYKDERKPRFTAFKTLITSPASRRAFIVVFLAYSMEVIMGLAPISVYAKQVFIEVDPTKGDFYSVILAVIWFCGSLLSGALTDKVGRRMLLIVSSFLVLICLLAIGIILQTKCAPAWVPMVIIMCYVFFFMVGPGTIPYVLMSEIFCAEVQTLGSMIVVEWLWLSGFFVLSIFNSMNRIFGIHITMYIFAFSSFLNIVFTYNMVPETKGLSNKEIQLALLKRRGK